MRRAIVVLGLAAVADAFSVVEARKPPAPALMKLRGGVSAGDVAHYGALTLSTAVGVPALVLTEEFFRGNFPGETWPAFKSKCSPDAYDQIMIMTKFFGAALTVNAVMQHFMRGHIADAIFYRIILGGQMLFALIQVFIAAPHSILPKVNFVYAGVNCVISIFALVTLLRLR